MIALVSWSVSGHSPTQVFSVMRGVAQGEPDPNLTRRHGDALEYCLRELSREHPDYQAAQVYATLSVEEALRDLATAIGWAADRIR